MRKIEEITKCVSENVLAIGVDQDIIKILEQNDRIKDCNLLDANIESNDTGKKEKKKKTKRIKIKKIRKIFKKKKVDFIICNIKSIKKYLKTFIKDSIYINKDMLYIYGVDNDELKEELIKKYKRYNTKIEIIKEKNDTILKIDNKNARTNLLKDIIYLGIDNFFFAIDIIGDMLSN